jgi:hypothetical protein
MTAVFVLVVALFVIDVLIVVLMVRRNRVILSQTHTTVNDSHQG